MNATALQVPVWDAWLRPPVSWSGASASVPETRTKFVQERLLDYYRQTIPQLNRDLLPLFAKRFGALLKVIQSAEPDELPFPSRDAFASLIMFLSSNKVSMCPHLTLRSDGGFSADWVNPNVTIDFNANGSGLCYWLEGTGAKPRLTKRELSIRELARGAIDLPFSW